MASLETRYKNDPQIKAMTDLVDAYRVERSIQLGGGDSERYDSESSITDVHNYNMCHMWRIVLPLWRILSSWIHW